MHIKSLQHCERNQAESNSITYMKPIIVSGAAVLPPIGAYLTKPGKSVLGLAQPRKLSK